MWRVHPKETQLLTEIRANPRDRDVKLVFADWLEDNDDEIVIGGAARARFIRESIYGKLSWHSERYVDKLCWCGPEYSWQIDTENHGSYSWQNFEEWSHRLGERVVVVTTTFNQKQGGTVEMWWEHGFVSKIRLSGRHWLQRGRMLVCGHFNSHGTSSTLLSNVSLTSWPRLGVGILPLDPNSPSVIQYPALYGGSILASLEGYEDERGGGRYTVQLPNGLSHGELVTILLKKEIQRWVGDLFPIEFELPKYRASPQLQSDLEGSLIMPEIGTNPAGDAYE